MRAVTRTMPVKNDRKDAAAIAQAMRTGWFRAVHVKSPTSQRLRVLLRYRRLLQAKRLDLENELRGTLTGFGLKPGKVRSDERRVGKGCVRSCSSRWVRDPYKTNTEKSPVP